MRNAPAQIAANARAHGGEAHAANRADGGADVWLALPAANGAASDALQPAAGETSAA